MNCEIGRILHLKSEIRNIKLDSVQFKISDFGFEVQDSSNFTIFLAFSIGSGTILAPFGHGWVSLFR
jgi:hypothetical protein